LVGRFPSGIVSSHSIHCCTTVRCCVSGDLLQVSKSRSPHGLFTKYCSSKNVYYKLVMPNCMPCPWVASVILIFKSNLSSFALWGTSSFFILSVRFIFNFLLQLRVSDSLTTLSSFFP
jgi:hypothetical protein